MQIQAVQFRVAISYIYLAFNENPTIPVSVVVVFANGAARLLKLETTKKPPSHSFSFKVHMMYERWKGERAKHTSRDPRFVTPSL